MNRVAVEKSVLSENDAHRGGTARSTSASGAFSLNFIGSPGAGKTALLERTLELPFRTCRVGRPDGRYSDRKRRPPPAALRLSGAARSRLPAPAIWTPAWWKSI